MDGWNGEERRKQSNHCQQQILDRLTEIEVEMRLMRPVLQKLDKALCGNGTKGLLIEHDRVQRSVNAICWALGVIYSAVILMVVKRWMG